MPAPAPQPSQAGSRGHHLVTAAAAARTIARADGGAGGGGGGRSRRQLRRLLRRYDHRRDAAPRARPVSDGVEAGERTGEVRTAAAHLLRRHLPAEHRAWKLSVKRQEVCAEALLRTAMREPM